MFVIALTGSQVKVPGGYYSAECNLKIFNLSTDEICTILETIDLKGYRKVNQSLANYGPYLLHSNSIWLLFLTLYSYS